jgi:hypothetical protein
MFRRAMLPTSSGIALSVIGCRPDDMCFIPSRGGDFSFCRHVHRGCGARPASCALNTRDKPVEREASAEFKTARSFPSSSPCFFIVWTTLNGWFLGLVC